MLAARAARATTVLRTAGCSPAASAWSDAVAAASGAAGHSSAGPAEAAVTPGALSAAAAGHEDAIVKRVRRLFARPMHRRRRDHGEQNLPVCRRRYSRRAATGCLSERCLQREGRVVRAEHNGMIACTRPPRPLRFPSDPAPPPPAPRATTVIVRTPGGTTKDCFLPSVVKRPMTLQRGFDVGNAARDSVVGCQPPHPVNVAAAAVTANAHLMPASRHRDPDRDRAQRRAPRRLAADQFDGRASGREGRDRRDCIGAAARGLLLARIACKAKRHARDALGIDHCEQLIV